MKNTQSKIKPRKIEKKAWSNVFYFEYNKDYIQNFRPEKVKMTNKVLRHCVVFQLNKSRFIKQKIN